MIALTALFSQTSVVSAATTPTAQLVKETFNTSQHAIVQTYNITPDQKTSHLENVSIQIPYSIFQQAQKNQQPLLFSVEQLYAGYETYQNQIGIQTLNGEKNQVLSGYRIQVAPTYAQKFNQMEAAAYQFAQHNLSKQNYNRAFFSNKNINEPYMNPVSIKNDNIKKPKNAKVNPANTTQIQTQKAQSTHWIPLVIVLISILLLALFVILKRRW